ncbi:protein FAM160A1 [Cyclopterus lumpus]|uniref:FHF complex subunit HOOK interacting protein 1A n=1 Tax=Cyclopterus lumpus TaxID=8103 RepID=A0A8C2XSC3_CYCLU|nr:protein FAM160A1 [Cyclopterus lumpus]XP_034390940.1 protein FAM160A1 [Cyclopterus lumpus]XP_034390950.1 protein FAM160A1 [Cyclopterus lumpus]XP_034390959.1 protein FAM160A1 [Cyclopterus lumpus]XP_034390968.1 protein FAM160A1 [Cyclopterus lumpus]XP_034390976.1 protein FAM160A1 [Cyclopterus lumpus]XP_034390985.1 protein FAM160A1 [Cyclopterus lumpus]
MASMVANGNPDGPSLVLKGVDPETCMIVFKNHWSQVVKILEKHDPLRGTSTLPSLSVLNLSGGPRFGPVPGDEASAVQNYVEHMLFLLMEEESGQAGAMGPILEFVVMENVMERLFVWSLRREFTDDMKLEQLKMYEMLAGQARQPLLHHKPILRPLIMLLSSCSGTAAPQVEAELVLLLNQLCCVLAKDPSILELFFHTSEDQGATNFLIFSLLIPFIHREGTVGQQARDALLLIMSLSAENERVAKHIAENTYFCPVLATGLSGLYSSLPTKLDFPSADWHCLHKEDWLRVPSLVQFLNSLEFCNAVIQVAHPDIRDQLVSYIYKGFLVPVLAPALHKLTLEEVMTTTAYLDLFLRTVSEPTLLQTFLSFILLHRHENVHILDTLVSRINTPFQLGTVSLALFRTLIGLYCEDVMLQLILRYLIPCNHMMLSQRRVVGERDCYSVSAAKILALTPSCCSPDHSPPPLRQLDSILFSKGAETPNNTSATEERESFVEDDDGSGNSCTIGSEIYLDVSYLHYLYDARLSISSCIKACQVWSAPYDGEDPPPEKYQPGVLEEPGLKSWQTQMAFKRVPHPLAPRPCPPPRTEPPSITQQELEWDDSYDACPVQTGQAPVEPKRPQPPPAEPPKHIQEMRKTAIMFVQGSYIEENEFQDDVMVYDLVAKKDTRDIESVRLKSSGSEPGSAEVPLKNGLSLTLPTSVMADKNTSDTKAKGQTDCNSHLQNTTAAEPGDELLAQYEELIRTLDTKAGGKQFRPDGEFKKPVTPAEEDEDEEEEEMDFTSFSAETPEPEKLQSPFGPKFGSGSVGRKTSAPFTGPFVSVLLSRLENMQSNTLQVNLLLTGILAQLAAYPQPLLRSFLLNTNLVFQPTVRSLYQVLATVKNQIEEQSATRTDFPELITAAQHWLLARETSLTAADDSRSSAHGEAARMRKSSPPPKPKAISLERTEVFATVLFTEFLKELAAIAQEHSILSYIPMEE